MKKLIALLMGLVCVMNLAACGGEAEKAETFALSDLETIVEKGAFSEELAPLDADTAFMLYQLSGAGLAREDLVEGSVLLSTGATCETGAVLIFTDAEKAAAAAEALEGYVADQIESNEDYRPNEIPKLEGAILMQEGNSVLLVVPNDAAAVRNVLG